MTKSKSEVLTVARIKPAHMTQGDAKKRMRTPNQLIHRQTGTHKQPTKVAEMHRIERERERERERE